MAAPVLEEVLEEILAQEEAAAEQEEQPEEVPVPQDELEAFTLDDVMVDEAVEEEEEDEDLPFDMGDEIWEIPQLTPGRGQDTFRRGYQWTSSAVEEDARDAVGARGRLKPVGDNRQPGRF